LVVYESPLGRVQFRMRSSILSLILLTGFTGSADAQWKPASKSPRNSPISKFGREMLDAHNSVRARVGVPSLSWSPQLAAYAQVWANSLLARNEFGHRQRVKYGENLFAITGVTASPAHVVAEWAAEYDEYDYRTNRCSGACGHYTQIVWGETKQLGCAVARGGGREVSVCNYDPAGNWVGRRPY